MNRLYSYNLVFAVALALSACQSVSTPTPKIADTDDFGEEIAEIVTPAPEPIVYGSFTKDELNRAIINELAGHRGYLPDAAADYYALANETGDLGIIRRASQFASAMGDTERMVVLAQMWIDKDPKAIDPHMMLSSQFLESGRFDEALIHMARVLDLGGRIDFSSLSSRTENLSSDERAELIVGIRELRKDYPAVRSLHYSLIQLLEQAQQPQIAMAELNAYRSEYGNSARMMLIEAQLLLQQDQTQKSLDVLKAGIEAYPNNRLMRFNYARILVQIEDLENARTQFSMLAQMAPDDYETLYSLALLDLELESINNAKSLLTQLVQVNYRPNESHFYLGYIAEKEGNNREAIAQYQQVRIDADNFVNAQRLAIRLLVQEDGFAGSHAWVMRVSEGNPRLEILLTTIEADALIAADRLDLADTLLSETISKYPQDTNLLFARAMVNEREGNMPESEQDLRRIIELAPQDSRALNHLGYTLADSTDRYDEALALLERAIAVSPEDPAIIDSLAWAQYKLGHYEEALANLERAYVVFPDPEVAAHLGEVLWAMGRRDEASRVWGNALRDAPDSDLLKTVIERFTTGINS